MRYKPIEPPRTFEVGLSETIELKDCARIELAADEQVTFVSASGSEYDLVRKSWGYYATPSLNNRLVRCGLRGVLVKNRLGHYFVLLVERGRTGAFEQYLEAEQLAIVSWLDADHELQRIERGIKR